MYLDDPRAARHSLGDLEDALPQREGLLGEALPVQAPSLGVSFGEGFTPQHRLCGCHEDTAPTRANEDPSCLVGRTRPDGRKSDGHVDGDDIDRLPCDTAQVRREEGTREDAVAQGHRYPAVPAAVDAEHARHRGPAVGSRTRPK